MEIDSFLDDSKVNRNVGNNIVEATYCDSVIEITKTLPQNELTEYDCWSIFKERAFANKRPLPLDLKKIGKEIVKKCKRVPWAARFLGGIMYLIRDNGEWLSIQNNKIWDLSDDDNNGVFHILKLGYDHLQKPSLKRCFAYCAVFRKDYDMEKDEVIQHWIAEGFLEPSKEANMVMEDIEEGYWIKEMGPLKNIRGEISIYNLEVVEDEEEAKSPKLKEKEIFKLGLYWKDRDGHCYNFRAAESNYDKDERVLEGLQPHSNLKSMGIEFYGGKKFPSWVGLSLYHNLIEIKLSSSHKCEEVPTLGHLPCLRVLEMRGMRKWKDAKELTNAGEVLVFPCLEELTIIYCDKLRDLPDSLHTCISLQKLVVESCLDLSSLPGVLSPIQQLEIKNCSTEELPRGIQFCTSLQYLEIGRCSNLKSIPESLQSCVSLQKFEVRYCRHVRYLPGVPSVIQHLEIIGCGIDELPSGLQFCTSLLFLKIGDCPNLKSIPDLGEVFHSLIHLKLSNCPDLRLKLSRREGHLKDFDNRWVY
ncbi:disease resistance protein RGA2-like [Quercus robur]|uniref:disease resistance protein RGA2-like n=1 Tax=Quercus robur TaxID=38942 RepID=UPI002163B3F5|nr:disease resistance protein RGA2-like [Quercus robur]